jgi:hypothetical protein
MASLTLPKEWGAITVNQVLQVEAGEPRDLLIKKWCESVWIAYAHWHPAIAHLAKTELIVM